MEHLNLKVILTHKEVFNPKVGLVLSYKERYLALVNMGTSSTYQGCDGQEVATHVVVFKKNILTGQKAEAKKMLKGIGSSLKASVLDFKKDGKNPFAAFTQNKTAVPSFVAADPVSAQAAEEDPSSEKWKEDHWEVKSVTPLDRLYNIDIKTEGMVSITTYLKMTFAIENEEKKLMPKVKEYIFLTTHKMLPTEVQQLEMKDKLLWLQDLQIDALQVSNYYKNQS